MASFDYRLNPLYPIKECSSCRALYTTDYCCSDGSLGDKIICDVNKTPDLTQRPPQNCPKCGNVVDGQYCQGCALLRKKFKEDLFTYCEENGILQCLLDASEPSMTIPTLLMLFKSHSLSIKTPEEEKQIKEEQAAKARYWKILVCYDDDDDEDYTIAITLKEPDNSLSMGDEHLDTIPATKSDEFIKSSIENLVLNPSESEGKHECDVPSCEDFTTFSNIIFDADYDFSSVDDQSFYDEDIPKEIYSNPLFDEEIISIKIDPHYFNAESDGINETDCDPEEEIRLIKRLLYDNSSPRPPKECISENSDIAFESFSPFPIPVEDSDSLMEEIDLSFTSDDPIPPGIEEDDYDSKRDILILEELLSNDSFSLPENESFHFDIPSSSRPSAKPPDGNSGILNVKVMGDIYEHKVFMPRLMLTLVPNQEKSPNILSHQGHEAFQPSTEYPMMIYGRNIPILDVPFFHFYPP
nr:hypothetical protein [Tanacetum cinerariifolium]